MFTWAYLMYTTSSVLIAETNQEYVMLCVISACGLLVSGSYKYLSM